MIRIAVILACCSAFLLNCTNVISPSDRIYRASEARFKLPFTDTTYTVNYQGNPYHVYFKIPDNCNEELILFLPGWNYSVLDWKNKTKVWKMADSLGFATLLVEMGKSVYMDSVYPEARADYRTFPTRTWLKDSILYRFKEYGWFDTIAGSRIAHIMGLSTGARGAVALAYELPNLGLVSALSGDYFTMMDTADALLKNSMGPYFKFPSRWKYGSNNIGNRGPISCDIFIAHGYEDKIVPFRHSEKIANRLKSLNIDSSEYQVFTYFPKKAGHNYSFWNEAGLRALEKISNR